MSPEKESVATFPSTGNHRGKKGTYLDKVSSQRRSTFRKNTLLLEDPLTSGVNSSNPVEKEV